MKKIILSSIVLIVFAFSIAIFQISCQKDASAQTTSYTLPPATTTTLGGVIVGNGLNITSNGVLSVNNPSTTPLTQLNLIAYFKVISSGYEIWLANLDGTNQRKIPIPLNTTQKIGDAGVKLTPDGKVAIFTVIDNFSSSSPVYSLYSCNVDGTNFKK